MFIENSMQVLLLGRGGGVKNPGLVLQKSLDRCPVDPQVRTPRKQSLDLCVRHSVLQQRVNPIVRYTLYLEALPDNEGPSRREPHDETLTDKRGWGHLAPTSEGVNHPEDRTEGHRVVDGPLAVKVCTPASPRIPVQPSGHLHVLEVAFRHQAGLYTAVCSFQNVSCTKGSLGWPSSKLSGIAASDVHETRLEVCELAVL